jgi:uncharacterized protein involved in outer membrane biogenesis
MRRSLVIRGLKWAGCALGAGLLVIVILAVALDKGAFRAALIHFMSLRTGRPLKIEGALQVHVLSLHPRLIAEGVTIGNPSWTPAGTTAEIGKLVVVVAMPWFGHLSAIENLEMQATTLHLIRDSRGHANWQWTDPDLAAGKGLPLIRSLSMPGAHVQLDDSRRHLQFDGTVTAQEVIKPGELRPLRIEGMGRLNGRFATFQIDGEPLAAAEHTKPYHFTFTEHSSGSRLSGTGSVPRPFDFSILDATFEAAGMDLKDLYFLTGVTLVNTGRYQLSGKLARRGTRFEFADLTAASGQSDMQGTVSIETANERSTLDADLSSRLLRLSDLGARAAGRDPDAAARAKLLLSAVALKPSAARRVDGVVKFHARRVDVGRVPLQAVAAKLTIDHGILVLAPLSADVLGGKLAAEARVDATTDSPVASLDLKLNDVQLAQLDRTRPGPPPVEGLLRARVVLKGHGSSLHEAASNADGTVTAVLPSGTIRDSLAELSGIDLRGLGLLAAKNSQETGVRCGVASFQAHDGTLTAQSLVVDTDPVLITGEGAIHLDAESLDLTLRGHPKGLRLRLRSSVLIQGTLAQPTMGIQARPAVVQTVAAVALGVVLTPLASVLAFVDPGLTKDADCAALLNTAKTLEAAPKTAPAPAPAR